MKKIKSFFILMLSFLFVCSCSIINPSSSSSTSISSTSSSSSLVELPEDNVSSLPKSTEDVGFAVHYYRKDARYSAYNLWLWEVGADGADYSFTGKDDYGAVARYTFEEFSKTALGNGIGFIVKEAKVWAESPAKDVEEDRFMEFSFLNKDEYGYYNIYLKSQDKNIYVDDKGQILDVVQYFDLAYNAKTGFKIWFQTNNPIDTFEIKRGEVVLLSSNDKNNPNVEQITEKKVVLKLGQELPSITEDYTLSVTFKTSGNTISSIANKAVLYKTQEFSELYDYDGELGAIYNKDSTTFRVWSPISKSIKLRVYNTGTPASVKLNGKDVIFADGSDVYEEYVMDQTEKGTWTKTLQGDLGGKYYTYVVTNANYKDAEIVDPYAKSTGINGYRGMIVDFDQTNPEGWENVVLNGKKDTELVVYETHIADLTSSSTWNGTAENAKTYVGFAEKGTSYKGVTTGFDHVKELGVNAVQIIPIFDQANDERPNDIRTDGTAREFNWGYNPLNYNALDGIYSKDPFDGYTKIREFKQLVQAYSNEGINIIMDVVYNHVAGLEKSNFDVLMPHYYFRYTGGNPSNGSGCGNETASEMPMFRKFMIDSTEFWAKEYKLGGFRFDLMGLHDVETMNQLTTNLKKNVNETITVYGEPWAGGTSALASPNVAATQTAMNKFDGFGCFNDKMRDALIKGGLNGPASQGWITNATSASTADMKDIEAGIKGLVINTNTTIEPEKCINYVTCHDNYTLYDRIKAAGINDETTVKKMAMLANSVVLTSQGVKFVLAGEEFLRTKGGNENSYNASYEVNELNYELKVQNMDIFENYKKLIALNKETSLFSKDGVVCKDIQVTISSDSSLIVYELYDEVSGKTYKIAHCNGYAGSASKVVDFEGYSLYLDTLHINNSLSGSIEVQPYQTIIAYK